MDRMFPLLASLGDQFLLEAFGAGAVEGHLEVGQVPPFPHSISISLPFYPGARG